MRLDVYVRDTMVGVLEQTERARFVFTYLPNTPRDRAVSLLMPVRAESWVSPFLHPVFQVSLPEGALRLALERAFAKQVDRFDDMELLAVVGENLVGQLQLVPQGVVPQDRTPHETLENLVSGETSQLVEHYLGARLPDSGVSGGFLKFLARSPVGATPGKKTHHLTLGYDRWIVKLADEDRPFIVPLEYFGMRAAREAGLDVPEIKLSEDRERLLVRRFDRDAAGERLGFEDMCALLGLPAREKFVGSVERIVRVIRAFCPGARGAENLDAFYGQYVLASVLRNGDAHLKNFGLLYGPGQPPRLAPVYDMLSMAVYAPRDNTGDAQDGMALTLGGTKRWLTDKTLKVLAVLCGVPTPRQQSWAQRITAAVLTVGDEIRRTCDGYPGFTPTVARMLELWSHGVRLLDVEAAQTLERMAAEVAQECDAPTGAVQNFVFRPRCLPGV